MRVSFFVVASFVVAAVTGCARNPWLSVLDGMKVAQVTTELSTPEQNLAALAPAGFAVDKDNRWVLFLYDPKASPGVEASFVRLADDCFTAPVVTEADEPARYAAICAFERVPPVPTGQEVPGV